MIGSLNQSLYNHHLYLQPNNNNKSFKKIKINNNNNNDNDKNNNNNNNNNDDDDEEEEKVEEEEEVNILKEEMCDGKKKENLSTSLNVAVVDLDIGCEGNADTVSVRATFRGC